MKVKLIRALSYDGVVKATKKNPIVDGLDEETAKAAIATGYFEEVPEEVQESASNEKIKSEDPDNKSGSPDSKEKTVKTLDEMNTKELEAYATEKGYDLAGLSSKKEKYEFIKELESAAKDNTDTPVLDGILN